MIAYCTYCSAQKRHSKSELTAIELYKSERITEIFNLANAAETKFMILSGKYGVIATDQKVDYYDHLLTSDEVEKHSEIVAVQLIENKISQVIFFANSIERDTNLQPYIDCISIACAKVGIPIEFREVNFDD